MNARYAIYFAPPPQAALWEAACHWLGRDPLRDAIVEQPEVSGYSSERLQALTHSPRLYGFHATLKAPFRLADGCTAEALRGSLRRFAAQRASFAAPPLEVATLSRFLALCPVQRSGALHALADDCVTAFDAFRRAPEADELARRRVTQLSARQEALLERFGYPYVLEEFRFHMTLTERLAPADAHHLKTWLARFLSAALREPAVVDAICLFVQERPGGAFRITDRFAFGSV